MRFFLISILLISLASCKSYQPAGVIQSETSKITYKNFLFDRDSAYLYKANIEVYGNQLSGILIVKKTGEDAHRVALTSAFGNTLMDFSISKDEMKVHYILDDLNRKVLLKKRGLSPLFFVLCKVVQIVKKTFDLSTHLQK